MTPQAFIHKWQRANLSERSACQQHFLDLCDLLGQPKPAEADPDGTHYTFERGVSKTDGGQGWADVWFRGHFGWEYKGKHKNLHAAYQQLLLYREDLENPPLLVVCDLDRFEVHTNFTGTAKRVYAFDLSSLAEPANLDVLRRLFADPESLRPGETRRHVTEEAARRFGDIADGLRRRQVPSERAAHFLMKLMFCMFGEDIGLLPAKVFSRTLANCKSSPKKLSATLAQLFQAMAAGGAFGPEEIPHFNGGLFADADVVDLTPLEIDELGRANEHDWANVEPSIFGTLFERTLDPAKRSQIGAHYTSREDIETLVEPVVMAPLRRQWAAVRTRCEGLRAKFPQPGGKATARDSKPRRDFAKTLQDFIARLDSVSILDPACGSGNFLYVAINMLLDLEKEVITYGLAHGVAQLPQIRPTQLAGIEINPYAQQLAQVVIWIGYLQWMHFNGFTPPDDPILAPIDSIRCQDAILDLTDPQHPREPEWPKAEFIVGNPPFLGYSKLRAALGHEYVETLFKLYADRLSNQSDICCYWFEKARAAVERQRTARAGLLATQAIRGGKNREVLKAIEKSGGIFFAESDRDWVLDGANVHVSMVAFDNARETERTLDGQLVGRINANLTAANDITTARVLQSNKAIAFVGGFKFGPFEIDEAIAMRLIHTPNLHNRPNSQVIRPWINGLDVLRRPRHVWIVDFGVNASLAEAALYDAPFAHVEKTVKPMRDVMRRETRRERWWLHGESAGSLRTAQAGLTRCLVTPRVAKYRMFVWTDSATLVDGACVAIARQEDYWLGVLQSRVHECWALLLGTRLETRPRYTPTTCFETFPFPEPTDSQRAAIGAAAKELDELRSRWLNPPEWTKEEVLEFPGSADGPWARYVHDADARGIGTVRYPRVVARDGEYAKLLVKRTLTNLYNERPAWLDLAHRRLDEAVFAAYGWPADLADEELLARLLALNLSRSSVT